MSGARRVFSAVGHSCMYGSLRVSQGVVRCEWCEGDPLYQSYHDQEWGVPVHDDVRLYEMLTLEGAQAGLSWITVLRKRETYREAFSRFDPVVVSQFSERDVERLLANEGIIRNRAKVLAAVSNAQRVLEVQAELGSFDRFIWKFVNGEPFVNRFTSLSEIPAETPGSVHMSRELRRRGFKFVGPTICYAFMQAIGMVNDHVVSCFRHREVLRDS